MILRELLAGTAHTSSGAETTAVGGVAIDSREVTPGSVFVAVPGVQLDGHDFLPQASAGGAAALIVEDAARVPSTFTGAVVVVPSARAALNHCASRLFGDPGKSLFCVGVTGTDGKTSVAWMVEAVLAAAGVPTAVIGTVNHHFGEHVWPGETTPPPLALQERLARFVALGARAVALEATSQGLSQSRVSSVPFDVAVFTNLTRDHLDYHRSLEAYFEAKERLFTEALAASPKSNRHAIINVDTPYGARVRVPEGVTRRTYGRLGTGADFTYQVLSTSLDRSVFSLRAGTEEAELALPMLGSFNGANAIAAVAVGVAAGHGFRGSVGALREFGGVPGRSERVGGPDGPAIFIDYAHDPDAFQQVLGTAQAALRSERPSARLFTVFGCGGDRDRGKRPLMLEAALRSSDRVFITADNPRSEDPHAIADDVLRGLPAAADRERVVVELDRTRAIALAITEAGIGDVVMILGKGHEPYQIVGARRIPYSDHAAVQAALARPGEG